MSEYWPIFIIVLQLIFLEGILSIDNAAVIGALVSPLPEDKHVEWPGRLQRFGEWLHPVSHASPGDDAPGLDGKDLILAFSQDLAKALRSTPET